MELFSSRRLTTRMMAAVSGLSFEGSRCNQLSIWFIALLSCVLHFIAPEGTQPDEANEATGNYGEASDKQQLNPSLCRYLLFIIIFRKLRETNRKFLFHRKALECTPACR